MPEARITRTAEALWGRLGGAPPLPHTGLHKISAADLETVARTYLYTGQAEGVAGGILLHEAAPASIGQMGVCVVCYNGRLDQWLHGLAARQELAFTTGDPTEQAMAILEQRQGAAPGAPPRLHQLSAVARCGFARYMERDVMLTECKGWRIGRGAPAPLDLLTGLGSMELLEISLDLLQRLLLGETRWVFVSETSPVETLGTLATALEPLEFAVMTRLHTELKDQAEIGRYSITSSTREVYAPFRAENQAAYISGWLGALKGDKRLLPIAAAQAQKAADFILATRHAPAEQPED